MSVIFYILYTSHAGQQGEIHSFCVSIFALLVDKQLMYHGNSHSRGIVYRILMKKFHINKLRFSKLSL